MNLIIRALSSSDFVNKSKIMIFLIYIILVLRHFQKFQTYIVSASLMQRVDRPGRQKTPHVGKFLTSDSPCDEHMCKPCAPKEDTWSLTKVRQRNQLLGAINSGNATRRNWKGIMYSCTDHWSDGTKIRQRHTEELWEIIYRLQIMDGTINSRTFVDSLKAWKLCDI